LRTRDVRCRTPPAQIRTSGFPASGSYLRCLTASVEVRLAVRAPAPVTRFPGPAPGACFAGPRSPRFPPFAPPAPPPVARHCSQVSSLLWQDQTSRGRASSASAPRLPDAGQSRHAALVNHETSRFPYKERLHMPGSPTTPGRRGACDSRPFVWPFAYRTASAPGNRPFIAVGAAIAGRPPGHRRRSPAPGSHRTWRADFPHQRSSAVGSQHCERLQLPAWETQFRCQQRCPFFDLVEG